MKDIIKKAKLGGHYERTTLVYDIHLNWLMDYVTNLGNGKMVECGVARGGCIALCHIANPDLQIIGLDSWEPMPDITENDDVKQCKPWVGTSIGGKIEDVKTSYTFLGASDENLTLLKGWFDQTIPNNMELFDNLDILRIDSDFYESVLFCLRTLFPKLNSGGLVILDDWAWNPKGVQSAFDEYSKEIGESFKIYVHTNGAGPAYFFKK
jgi:hypothetical protein